MLAKRTLLAIGKLPDTSISGLRTGSPDIITSPKSPLDFKNRSPRGFKNAVAGSGVGLGIVAALEISGAADGQTPAKFIVGSLNLTRSEPIPIGIKTSPARYRKGVVEVEESEIGCCENYTCVTSHHGPNNKSVTRVFFDGDEFGGGGGGGGGAWRYPGVSYGLPAATEEVAPAYPSSSFLSSCYLCRKTLHGRDIYMYRGEKAFCSAECRYKQIVSDERKEKCGSEASRSTDIAVSPYTGGQLFFTGITAA